MSRERRRMSRPVALLFVWLGVGALALAGVLAGMWLWTFTTYVPVRGRVLSVRVNEYGDGGGTKTYRPVVRYAYSVDGAKYESKRYGPVDEPGWRSWAEAAAGRYEPGESCVVYYARGDPSRSVLSRGLNTQWAGIMAGLAALGVFAIVTGRARLRAPP